MGWDGNLGIQPETTYRLTACSLSCHFKVTIVLRPCNDAETSWADERLICLTISYYYWLQHGALLVNPSRVSSFLCQPASLCGERRGVALSPLSARHCVHHDGPIIITAGACLFAHLFSVLSISSFFHAFHYAVPCLISQHFILN